MFDNYELTFIRVEGLGDVSTCSCNFFLDNLLHESQSVGDFESSQQILTVPCKGELKIRIEDQSLIASVQFSLSIIKCQGYHWLPLFTGENDLIEEVPEEVGLPRILLIFQSRKYLSPVIEITETSEVSENLEAPEFGDEVKVMELRSKIIELEQALQFEKMNQVQSIEKIVKEFKSEIDKKCFELEKVRMWSGEMRGKIDGLEMVVEERNREVLEKSEEIEGLREGWDEIKDELVRMARSRDEVLNELGLKDREILSLKSSIKNSFSLKICQSDPVQLTPVIKNKPKLINSSDLSKTTNQSNSDLLDYSLQSSLKDLKLEGFFQKTTETFYKAGSKRVGIVYKNKNIYCKIGDTYKTLENYIFSHLTEELEKFIKKRAISGPEHKRFKSFSGVIQDIKSSECKSVKILTPNLNSSAICKKKSITPGKSRLISTKTSC